MSKSTAAASSSSSSSGLDFEVIGVISAHIITVLDLQSNEISDVRVPGLEYIPKMPLVPRNNSNNNSSSNNSSGGVSYNSVAPGVLCDPLALEAREVVRKQFVGRPVELIHSPLSQNTFAISSASVATSAAASPTTYSSAGSQKDKQQRQNSSSSSSSVGTAEGTFVEKDNFYHVIRSDNESVALCLLKRGLAKLPSFSSTRSSKKKNNNNNNNDNNINKKKKRNNKDDDDNNGDEDEYQEALLEAQTEAQRQRIGLWSENRRSLENQFSIFPFPSYDQEPVQAELLFASLSSGGGWIKVSVEKVLTVCSFEGLIYDSLQEIKFKIAGLSPPATPSIYRQGRSHSTKKMLNRIVEVRFVGYDRIGGWLFVQFKDERAERLVSQGLAHLDRRTVGWLSSSSSSTTTTTTTTKDLKTALLHASETALRERKGIYSALTSSSSSSSPGEDLDFIAAFSCDRREFVAKVSDVIGATQLIVRPLYYTSSCSSSSSSSSGGTDNNDDFLATSPFPSLESATLLSEAEVEEGSGLLTSLSSSSSSSSSLSPSRSSSSMMMMMTTTSSSASMNTTPSPTKKSGGEDDEEKKKKNSVAVETLLQTAVSRMPEAVGVKIAFLHEEQQQQYHPQVFSNWKKMSSNPNHQTLQINKTLLYARHFLREALLDQLVVVRPLVYDPAATTMTQSGTATTTAATASGSPSTTTTTSNSELTNNPSQTIFAEISLLLPRPKTTISSQSSQKQEQKQEGGGIQEQEGNKQEEKEKRNKKKEYQLVDLVEAMALRDLIFRPSFTSVPLPSFSSYVSPPTQLGLLLNQIRKIQEGEKKKQKEQEAEDLNNNNNKEEAQEQQEEKQEESGGGVEEEETKNSVNNKSKSKKKGGGKGGGRAKNQTKSSLSFETVTLIRPKKELSDPALLSDIANKIPTSSSGNSSSSSSVVLRGIVENADSIGALEIYLIDHNINIHAHLAHCKFVTSVTNGKHVQLSPSLKEKIRCFKREILHKNVLVEVVGIHNLSSSSSSPSTLKSAIEVSDSASETSATAATVPSSSSSSSSSSSPSKSSCALFDVIMAIAPELPKDTRRRNASAQMFLPQQCLPLLSLEKHDDEDDDDDDESSSNNTSTTIQAEEEEEQQDQKKEEGEKGSKNKKKKQKKKQKQKQPQTPLEKRIFALLLNNNSTAVGKQQQQQQVLNLKQYRTLNHASLELGFAILKTIPSSSSSSANLLVASLCDSFLLSVARKNGVWNDNDSLYVHKLNSALFEQQQQEQKEDQQRQLLRLQQQQQQEEEEEEERIIIRPQITFTNQPVFLATVVDVLPSGNCLLRLHQSFCFAVEQSIYYCSKVPVSSWNTVKQVHSQYLNRQQQLRVQQQVNSTQNKTTKSSTTPHNNNKIILVYVQDPRSCGCVLENSNWQRAVIQSVNVKHQQQQKKKPNYKKKMKKKATGEEEEVENNNQQEEEREEQQQQLEQESSSVNVVLLDAFFSPILTITSLEQIQLIDGKYHGEKAQEGNNNNNNLSREEQQTEVEEEEEKLRFFNNLRNLFEIPSLVASPKLAYFSGSVWASHPEALQALRSLLLKNNGTEERDVKVMPLYSMRHHHIIPRNEIVENFVLIAPDVEQQVSSVTTASASGKQDASNSNNNNSNNNIDFDVAHALKLHRLLREQLGLTFDTDAVENAPRFLSLLYS